MLKSAPTNRLKGWITIGGSPGERGENEGGTHVFIDDSTGKITAGPASLTGKPISEVDQGKLKPGEKPKPPPPPKKPTDRLTVKPEVPKPEAEEPIETPEDYEDEDFEEEPEDWEEDEDEAWDDEDEEEPDWEEEDEEPETVSSKPVEFAAFAGFPTDLTSLKKVKLLGGSTGAELVEDSTTGKEYVRKKGSSPNHLRSEAAADAAYQALGVSVPKFKLYDTPSGPVKLAEYQGNTLPLAKLPSGARKAAEEKLRQNFVADALLGNWDVIGLEEDNVLVTPEGQVFRIDNGGALSYRAQGAKKSAAAWSAEVTELKTLRDPNVNPQSAKVFGAVTDADIKAQVKDVLSKREALLKVLPEADAKVVAARLDWLEQNYSESAKPAEQPAPVKPEAPQEVPEAAPEQPSAAPTVEAPTTSPEPTPAPAKVPDYVGKPIGKGSTTPAKMNKFAKEHIAKLDPSVKQAVMNYTGSGYDQLNKDMRKCPPSFECVQGQSKQMMERVDKAVSVRLPEPVTVYRGAFLSQENLDKVLKAARNAEHGDDDYGMPSITSTSFKASTSFMKFANVVFHIRAKTGLPVSSISSFKSEHELIQSGRAKYKVVAVAKAPYGTSGKEKHVIYLEEQEWLPNPTTKNLKNIRTSTLGTTNGPKLCLKETRNGKSPRNRLTIKSLNPGRSSPVDRLKASFFETCDRDEAGHCKPGEGGDAGESQQESAPKQPSSEQQAKARNHVVQSILSSSVSLKDAAKSAAAKIGQAVWDKLSPKAQERLAKTYQLAKAVEHKVMAGFRAANDLAMKAAEERGASPEVAARVGKILATVDLASAWTVNMPAALAVTGSASVAKVASWVPVASLAYLSYSTARNPFATVRAARNMVRDWKAGKHKSWEKAVDQETLAGELTERLAKAADPDRWAALFSVAFDELGDAEGAMNAADELSGPKQRTKSLGPVNRLKDSYFEECERDDEGHCLPSGEGGGGSADEDSGKKPDAKDKPKRAAPGSQLPAKTLAKLKELGADKLPPADVPASDVKVNLDAGDSGALLTWKQTSKSGRTTQQSAYTAAFHTKNAAVKWERVQRVEPVLEAITKGLIERMQSGSQREREAAAITSCIRETGLRPTDSAESVKHGHFGISSLQGRHVKIKGNEVHLDFIGKEGVRNRTVIRDPANVAFVKEAMKNTGPKDFLFKEANSGDAIKTLKEVSKSVGGPEDILVKDLRTVNATRWGEEAVKNYKGPPPPLSGNAKKDGKAIAKAILTMSGEVSKRLNNNPGMARDNYIHPRVFQGWLQKLQAGG